MSGLLDCFMNQLMKRSRPYKHIGKRLKFLADLTRNTDIDKNNMTLRNSGEHR